LKVEEFKETFKIKADKVSLEEKSIKRGLILIIGEKGGNGVWGLGFRVSAFGDSEASGSCSE